MQSTIEMPGYVSRREGAGYVIFIGDQSRYLFANSNAHEALESLRAGRDAISASALLSGGGGMTAEEVLLSLVSVMIGERERFSPEWDGAAILRPLGDLVDQSSERCETFGMPL